VSTVKSRRDNLDDESVFRLFVDQVTDYAIFLLSPTGEVASWNPGAERIKGYKASEIIGRHFRIFYPPEDIANGKPERELEIAAANGRFEEEGWRLRKDGSRFWASVIITAVRDHDRLLLGFGKLTKDLTERKNSEEQMRELSGRLLKMQDEERRRLGRELHDTVGQYLSAAKMSLDGLASEEERFAEHQTNLAESIQMIERCIREVRTLSYLLYPPMLEETGLSSAIRWHLEGFSKRSAIQTTFEIQDDVGRLPQDVELALFRVFQESLTNVHRHSGSKTAHVRIVVEHHKVLLEIKDLGQGIPSHLLEVNSDSLATLGVGIRGMRERVRQLDGQLEIFSSPEGTTVRASIPLKERHAAVEGSALVL
jgi:PAS domain S-box-containing protein